MKPYKTRKLFYDIETSYIITKEKRWGLWDDQPIQREIVDDWQILCFAYQWEGEKKVHVVAQPDFKDYKPGKLNDFNVVSKLAELFTEADIVVAHNGNSFDQKKVQARMQIHHMQPPMPYQQIDTKLEFKKVGAHTSNKLMDLCRSLELQSKLDAGGMKTWDGCIAGDKKAWKQMKKYNKGDIVSLKELYYEIRPWMKSHPAINVLENKPEACPNCGKGPLIAGTKYAATKTNRYQYHRCAACGHPVKVRIPEHKQAHEKMKFTN